MFLLGSLLRVFFGGVTSQKITGENVFWKTLLLDGIIPPPHAVCQVFLYKFFYFLKNFFDFFKVDVIFLQIAHFYGMIRFPHPTISPRAALTSAPCPIPPSYRTCLPRAYLLSLLIPNLRRALSYINPPPRGVAAGRGTQGEGAKIFRLFKKSVAYIAQNGKFS